MSYSINLTNQDAQKIASKYQDYSLPSTNNYTLFRAKYKSCTLTIFKTNTMLLQGNDIDSVIEEINEIIVNPIPLKKATNSELSINMSYIGSDEVGVGDFFGGIVVVASFVSKEMIPQLSRLPIRDSKEMTDKKILEIAPMLIEKVPNTIHLLDNLKYNYFTKVKNYNLNKIKALLHNSAIYNLKNKITKYDGIIIDAFTNKNKYFEYLSDVTNIVNDVTLIQKAENQYISVAISSIIARYIYLKHMEQLSKQVGFDLPKGAGDKIDLAIKKILTNHNIKFFENIAKTNFKNFDKYNK